MWPGPPDHKKADSQVAEEAGVTGVEASPCEFGVSDHEMREDRTRSFVEHPGPEGGTYHLGPFQAVRDLKVALRKSEVSSLLAHQRACLDEEIMELSARFSREREKAVRTMYQRSAGAQLPLN